MRLNKIKTEEICLIKEKRKRCIIIQTLTWNEEYNRYVPKYKLKVGKEEYPFSEGLHAYGLGSQVFEGRF